ncbi:MAG: hypothetical protein ACR2RB_18385 [Gammaproteobacteria bacterium]
MKLLARNSIQTGAHLIEPGSLFDLPDDDPDIERLLRLEAVEKVERVIDREGAHAEAE